VLGAIFPCTTPDPADKEFGLVILRPVFDEASRFDLDAAREALEGQRVDFELFSAAVAGVLTIVSWHFVELLLCFTSPLLVDVPILCSSVPRIWDALGETETSDAKENL
jgi:hypothetical protein